MPYRCFLLERTDRTWRWLRRYGYANDTAQRCGNSYGHDATTFLDVVSAEGVDVDSRSEALRLFPSNDPRWPQTCEKCGAALDACEYQIFTLAIYRAADGSEYSLHPTPPAPATKAPFGAMWYADWMLPHYAGPDGHVLMVRCPVDHDWLVDGVASNCDMACANCGRPYHAHFGASGYTTSGCTGGYQPRDGGAHRCWVRHGTPPNVTVDKNGLTCNAGAGSIQTPGWHGFLRNGELTE